MSLLCTKCILSVRRRWKRKIPWTSRGKTHASMLIRYPKVGKCGRYIPTNDPMGLPHPEAGLSRDRFTLVDDVHDADIIYSYQSLFVERPLRDAWETRTHVLINQFPYEGAVLQKDHLGQEVLKQHGLPRPSWAIETYDLDVQLAEFVGACLLDAARSGDTPPVWIVKPASGTQSQGHVVTRSLGHILRLVDSGGGSRVAQRYIVRKVCNLLINVSCLDQYC